MNLYGIYREKKLVATELHAAGFTAEDVKVDFVKNLNYPEDIFVILLRKGTGETNAD